MNVSGELKEKVTCWNFVHICLQINKCTVCFFSLNRPPKHSQGTQEGATWHVTRAAKLCHSGTSRLFVFGTVDMWRHPLAGLHKWECALAYAILVGKWVEWESEHKANFFLRFVLGVVDGGWLLLVCGRAPPEARTMRIRRVSAQCGIFSLSAHNLPPLFLLFLVLVLFLLPVLLTLCKLGASWIANVCFGQHTCNWRSKHKFKHCVWRCQNDV